MDTIFPGSTLIWRAINDEGAQTLAYWLIITWEALTAIVLWAGVGRLFLALRRPDFGQSRTTAVVGTRVGLFTVCRWLHSCGRGMVRDVAIA